MVQYDTWDEEYEAFEIVEKEVERTDESIGPAELTRKLQLLVDTNLMGARHKLADALLCLVLKQHGYDTSVYEQMDKWYE